MASVSKRVQRPPRLYQYYKCTARLGGLVGKTCKLPGFRADHVDRVVWDWVRSLVTDPEALAEGLRAREAERKKHLESLFNDAQKKAEEDGDEGKPVGPVWD